MWPWKWKEYVMRCQNSISVFVALLLSFITITAMAYTEQFPQAAHAESVGFDALAHNLFGQLAGKDAQ
jgi:hypothetical protein